MKIDLFIPCFVDQLYPQSAVNMVHVLRKMDCEIRYNSKQTCCAQAAYNAGFWDEAKAVAIKFYKDFENADRIVSPSASCVAFLKQDLPKLLSDTIDADTLQAFTSKIHEFTEFLVTFCPIERLNPTLKGRAFYHDSCAAVHFFKNTEAPRKLLSRVQQLELIESNEAAVCCGFGGSFSVKFEPISLAMAADRVELCDKLGVNYLISADSSCLMQLQGYIEKKAYNIKCMHIADVLAG